MPFDPTLPQPLPEIDPQLFDELLGESERFVDSCDYRVMSDELPTRFLDFWLMPVAQTEAQRRRYKELYKSDEKGVLLQLPLHLFNYVYHCRFDPPTDGADEDETTDTRNPEELAAEALRRFESDTEFQDHMKSFLKRLHQFHVLLQYIRIMYETGMVHQMHRFDLFDVDAYEDVLTCIAGDLTETAINILDRVAEAKCSKT